MAPGANVTTTEGWTGEVRLCQRQQRALSERRGRRSSSAVQRETGIPVLRHWGQTGGGDEVIRLPDLSAFRDSVISRASLDRVSWAAEKMGDRARTGGCCCPSGRTRNAADAALVAERAEIPTARVEPAGRGSCSGHVPDRDALGEGAVRMAPRKQGLILHCQSAYNGRDLEASVDG